MRTLAAWFLAATTGMLACSDYVQALGLFSKCLLSFALGMASYAGFKLILWGPEK